MSASVIQPSSFGFLKKLSRNNNRDWFNKHKEEYLRAQENIQHFVDALIAKMNAHDQIETPSGKKSLYRIYNDVRFSDDKTPYNPRFAGSLRRVKPMLRGGYYYWIKPGGSRVGCGFTYPDSGDLKRLRLDIRDNYTDWNKLLNSKVLQSTFGEMLGDQVKTAPKGFSKDHPAIDLLRYKQFWFEHDFTDKEVLASDFLIQVNKTFRTIRPFFNYMSEVLTTNLNGELIV
ncbi:MAG: DUF2461 domain-containing protein [Bacteroidota bacterium]